MWNEKDNNNQGELPSIYLKDIKKINKVEFDDERVPKRDFVCYTTWNKKAEKVLFLLRQIVIQGKIFKVDSSKTSKGSSDLLRNWKSEKQKIKASKIMSRSVS